MFLTGITGKDSRGEPVLGPVKVNEIAPNVSGGKRSGGVMVLYPVTTEIMSNAKGPVFAYSTGSSPKDVYNRNSKGNSPFDAGFSRALLER